MSFAPKRLKRVVLSAHGIGRIVTSDNVFKAIKGVPEGSSFRGFSFDAVSNSINVFIEHESFDEVEEGAVVPQLDIQIQEFRQQEQEDEFDPYDLYGYNKAYPKITLY